jgi:hypothetical protein
MECSEVRSKQFKVLSAAIGVSAVVAMGTLTVALSNDRGSTSIVSDPEATLGETTTSEVATEIETTLAEPEVKAERHEGFG